MVEFAPNAEYEQAEDGRLQKFGLWAILDELSGGDILKWDALLLVENSTMLLKYAMMGDKSIIEYSYNELLKRKADNNG